jgi:hypothetical protein
VSKCLGTRDKSAPNGASIFVGTGTGVKVRALHCDGLCDLLSILLPDILKLDIRLDAVSDPAVVEMKLACFQRSNITSPCLWGDTPF